MNGPHSVCRPPPSPQQQIDTRILCLEEQNLVLKLRGKDLPVQDSWMQGGKADPYLSILKNRSSNAPLVVPKSGEYMGEVDDKNHLCVHYGKKQAQQNTLDPVWPELTIPVRSLCDNGNVYNPFLINIWDYDFECPNDDFMGFCVLTIFDLIKANLRQEGIPLQPGKAGHKWGGFLFVDEIKLHHQYSTWSRTDSINNNSFLNLIVQKGDIQAVRKRD